MLSGVKAKKSAAKKTTGLDEVEKSLLAFEARRQFISASMNMGWRLAITVVIPIVGGFKLDERLDSTPSLTLLGFIIAVTAGSMVVWRSIKEVNEEQAQAEAKRNNR